MRELGGRLKELTEPPRKLGKPSTTKKNKPVAKRHQMVSGSLALPYCFFFVSFFSYFNGSRAAAPVGDEVL